MMKPDPGTYALVLQSHSTATIQVGRWGGLALHRGYYLYVGSAFGPGGVRARLSRHLRAGKRKHWHIDFLREHVTPVEAWVNYEAEHLEHEWAGMLCGGPGMSPIRGFGCSDCNCQAHLFFTIDIPNINWPGEIVRILV